MKISAATEFRCAKFAVVFAVLAYWLSGAAFSSYSHAADAATGALGPWTQGPHPLFTLPSVSAAQVALASERGHVVIMHFFATWCEACLEEMPALNRFSDRSGDKIKIMAISVAEPETRVQRFLAVAPARFPVLLDRDRAIARAWNVSTLPTSIVTDRNLVPRFVAASNVDWDSIDPAKLIAEVAVGDR